MSGATKADITAFVLFLLCSNCRGAGWCQVNLLPADLMDRRVEITGPTDRKMVINAFNSGAKVYMADFEDSNAPTWTNLIEGQLNLMDAVRKNISFQDPKSGKQYHLNPSTAVLKASFALDSFHIIAVLMAFSPVNSRIFQGSFGFKRNQGEGTAQDVCCSSLGALLPMYY